MDARLNELMLGTEFVVEATGAEQQMLWGKFCKDSMFQTRFTTHAWKQINPGYLVCVGELAGFPVNVSLIWNTIDGALVLFYEAVSRVVDHDMVKDWLKERCSPYWDGGTRLAYTNAMNFHHVLDYIKNEHGKG